MQTRGFSRCRMLPLAGLILAGWVWIPNALTQTPEPEPTPAGALPPGVHAVSGDEFGGSGEDAEVLYRLIGEARLVGLGESAHRSGGILAAKARLIQFLVEHVGFRLVAFETEWTDAEGVQDYLQSTCDGDATEVVRASLRQLWHDTTTVRLVEWLCRFNLAHADDRVSFVGFNNIQPWHDVAALQRYLGDRGHDDGQPVGAGLARCEGAGAGSSAAYGPPEGHPPARPDDYAACIAALDTVDADLQADAALSPDEREILQLHALSLRGFEDWYRWEVHPEGPVATPRGNESRDAAMARILLHAMRERPGARVVASAHSLHLNTASEAFRVVFPPPAVAAHVWESTRRMGNWLSDSLGDDYRVVSFVAFQHSLEGERVAPLGDDLLAAYAPVAEKVLHDLGEPFLIVDLGAVEAGALFEPGQRVRLMVPITPQATGLGDVPLAETFDLLFFIDDAEPWTGLPDPGVR